MPRQHHLPATESNAYIHSHQVHPLIQLQPFQLMDEVSHACTHTVQSGIF